MTKPPPRSPPVPDAWLRPELVASWREIILVILVMIGPFIWHSTYAAWNGSATRFLPLLFSSHRLLANLVFESILLAFFLWVLHRRGWRPFDFRIRIGWWSSLQGLLLFGTAQILQIVAGMVLFIVVYSLQTHYTTFLEFILANSPHLQPHSIAVGWSIVIPAMVLNSFIEEMTCTGYVFTQFAAKRGPLFALLATVLLRLACHTYQDPLSLLRIGVIFLVFGAWYWRTRNLWTLIVAHAVLDLASFLLIKWHFG